MKNQLKFLAFLLLTIGLLSFDLPSGWHKAGSKPNSYEMGLDNENMHDGKSTATIKSIDKNIDGFGTLMQTCIPGKYLGKRVKMTAYVKSEKVKSISGLWFRVDQTNSSEPLAFDNMNNRPITGTTDWKKYEIVLDVPEKATKLAYGALLNGTGQIWFDTISFDIVDSTVKSTSMYPNAEPENLNFKK